MAGDSTTRQARRRTDVVLAIALGGALGSLARWEVLKALPQRSGELPVATWIVNGTGSFLIGLLMVVVLERGPRHRLLRPFLGVGVLGGYTTFSTYASDTHGLVLAGEPARAAVYHVGTLVTAVLATLVGMIVARAVSSARRPLS